MSQPTTPPPIRHRSRRLATLLLPAVVLLQACGPSLAQPEPAASAAVPEVLVVPARPAGASVELRLPARALAAESAQLYARATGFVSERRAELGDAVSEGQVLAVLSAPEIDQAVREAEASVGQASADEALAKANFDRAAALIGSGSISKELHAERDASYQVAKAARAAAEARLSSARERQRYTTIRAPFAGVISARNIERGDRVVGDQSAATPMFELIALDPLRIVVDVPQSAALQVHKGLKAEVSFPELPGETLPAEVARSAQSISGSAGGMRVELRLANPGGRIPSGMLGEVRLALPRTGSTVLVPISAVLRDARGARVAVVDADSNVDYRPVGTGRNLGNEIEVVSGLAPGESVIASPNALLEPGTRVSVRQLEKKS